MKAKKILTYLLCAAMLTPAMMFGSTVEAEGKTENGLYVNKTATYNEGTDDYTITLEAYATGEKTITSEYKDVPTDIILVLDQSGSMKDDIGTVYFSMYENNNTKNSSLYNQRHNGGNANLWYEVSKNNYVSVSVTKTNKYTELLDTYVNYDTSWGSVTSSCYWYYRENLYEKVGDEYKKVTLTREGKWYDNYTYTYTFADGTTVTSEGNNSTPDFGTHGSLWTPAADGNETVYTYTYTLNDDTVTIGTSTGASEKFTQKVLYKRNVSTGGGGSKLDALKTAVTNFADAVAKKAAGADGVLGTDDDVNHRIAMVGFASSTGYGNYNRNEYENTELFVGKSTYSYGDKAKSQYKNALQSMNTDAGYNNIIASKDSLDAYGGTFTNLGIEMANGIFSENEIKNNEKRNRVVIVFTDGYPGTGDSVSQSVANSAVEEAYKTKNTYNATVYTVGVFSGANGTPVEDVSSVSNVNRFMHLLSSNYKNAQSYSDSSKYGTKTYPANGKSYYLSASDSESLNNIFQQISEQIEDESASTTLDKTAVIKDIISPQFQLPTGTSNITLETYDCIGKNGTEYRWSDTPGDSSGITANTGKTEDGEDTVSVTGFDFADNYVGTINDQGTISYRGKKLVITFTVKKRDGFLGGNDVPTNTNANVYEDATSENPVATFPRPTVNVPIQDVTVTAEDKNVYLLGNLTAEQIKSGATVKCGDVELNLVADNYGLESWQYAYVDIEIKYTDASGNTITGLSQLKDDTTYTVSATVKPISDGVTANADGITAVGTPNEMDGESGNGNGNINVFKPELTFKDSTVYNGNPVPTDDDYKSNNYDSTVWKHKATDGTETTANPDNMIGIAPELTFTYTPDASQIDGDKIDATSDKIGVAVLVKIGETDITDKVYGFKHIICTDVEGCAHPDGNYKFWLHILSTDLIIKKTVDEIVEVQSFLFTITLEDGTKLKVEIGSDDFNGKTATVTIKDLKVGQEYTVTEDTSWSWRYTIVGNSTVTKALSANKADNVFAFENKLKPEKWLGEETFVENYWKDKVTIVKDNDLPWKKSN